MAEQFGKIKAMAIAAMAVLTSYLGWLALPFCLLVLCNIIDYATGLIAAPYRGQARSSDRGFKGIAKKICMWLLVVVAGVVDLLIASTVDLFGVALPFSFAIASVACIWLLANELLSILENIGDIGVPIPPFLRPLAEWVKKTAEDKTKMK